MKLENIGKGLDENWREYSFVLITFLYCMAGYLFKIDKRIFWNLIHSNTLGWILALSTLLFAVYITYGLLDCYGLDCWSGIKS